MLQEFFDMHPLDQFQPIEFRYDDLDDLVKATGAPLFRTSARFGLTD